ncbi:F-box/WD repeat-containing protein [Candidatus Protochlamydia amoebophila]|nr:F-box-like domain-containing protein [Candidatus Protochlamydia amoebophila]
MNLENSISHHLHIFPAFKELEKKQISSNTEAYTEIGIKIFSKLSIKDLGSAEQVCREWKQLISGKNVWKIKLKQLFLEKNLAKNSIEHLDEQQSIENLSDEIHLHIFSFLSFQDLATVRRVSKQWHSKASDESLWNLFLEKIFPLLSCASKEMEIHPRNQLMAQANIKTKRVQNTIDLKAAALEKGHKQYAHTSFSPNGQRVIITSNEGISLWDTQTGKFLQVLEVRGGEGAPCPNVRFSPNGERIVSSFGKSKSCRLWDATTGKCVQTLEESWCRVYFSPNSQQLVTISRTSARLWDAQTGKCLQFLGDNPSFNEFIPFSSDSQRIISNDGTSVCLWNAQTGNRLQTLENIKLLATSFSPDSQQLAICDTLSIRLFDARTGECLQTLENDCSSDSKIFFSPDSQRIITNNGKFVRLWDVQTGKSLKTFEKSSEYPPTTFMTTFFSPNSQRIITTNGGTVRLWNARTGKHLKDLEKSKWSVEVKFSPNSQRIVTASCKFFRLFDAQTGKCLQQKPEEDRFSVTAVFSADSQRLITYHTQSILWDTQTGKRLKTWEEEEAHQVDFFPNSKWIITDNGKFVRLWDATTGKHLHILENRLEFQGITFSPDNKRVLVSPNGGQLLIDMKIFDYFPSKKEDFEEINSLTQELTGRELKKRKVISVKDKEDISKISHKSQRNPSFSKKKRKKED